MVAATGGSTNGALHLPAMAHECGIEFDLFDVAEIFKSTPYIADLKPGMVLEGTVTNVAAFGAFVDVGVHQDGLVHISEMADRFVKDPREVVKAGDVVNVAAGDYDGFSLGVNRAARGTVEEPIVFNDRTVIDKSSYAQATITVANPDSPDGVFIAPGSRHIVIKVFNIRNPDGVMSAGLTTPRVFVVDDGVDTGPIIAQGVVDIRAEDDESALHERIKEVERGLLVDVVGRLARDGFSIEGRKVVIP